MGQGASTPKRKKKKKSKHSSEPQDPALLKLDEKIALIKQDLIRTRQMGEVNQRSQEDEIYKFEMELYKKKYQLHRRGNEAKSYLSFWDYVEIVNTVLHADSFSVGSGDMTLEQHKAKMKAQAEEERLKAEKGTLIRHTGNFNIYSFFEAFLLRRLHIAMILKHQRSKQSEVWNDIVMFMYNKMPGMKKQTKVVNEKYVTLKPESNETLREMIKLRKKKIKLYGRMIENLKEELREEQMNSSMDDDKLLEGLEVPTKTGDPNNTSGEEDFNTAKYYQKGSFKDDDEMSFKSMSSRKSSRSKRNRASKTSAADNPRWMKTRNSKMSQSIKRDMDSSFRNSNLESSERSNRSPSPSPVLSPVGSRASKASGDNSKITDDDIERFLYPNKPVRKSAGTKVRNSGGMGSNRESLPSEFEIDADGRTTVSALHDDVSVGSSGQGNDRPTSLAEAKAKKKELDILIKSMETPGEEDE